MNRYPRDEQSAALNRMSMLLFVLIATLATTNAIFFTWQTAIEVPGSDAWYFLDTFVRHAVNGQLQLTDFFVQRGPSDHAQPMQKLVLWSHLRLANLDFRLEALVGVMAGIVAYAFLAWRLLKHVPTGADRIRAAAGACLIFVVGFSLNSTNLYTWSLVALGWLLLVVCFAYWSLLGRTRTPARMALVAFAATFMISLLLDELAYPAVISAILAITIRDGTRRPANGAIAMMAGGIGLFAGRLLLLRLSPGQTAAEYSDGSVAGLMPTLFKADAWKLVVVPLSESLVHQSNVQTVAPKLMGPAGWGIALVLCVAHLAFWAKALLGKRQPAPELLVIAVAMMLFFYATIAGVALSRIPTFGMDYLHQPRYVMMYQLNIIALILMFFTPEQGEEMPALPWLKFVLGATFVFLVLLQVPLSRLAWNSAPYVQNYASGAKQAMLELGANPKFVPPEGCPPILTVCDMPTSKRIELMDMLKQHHLSLYADDRVTDAAMRGGNATPGVVACNVEVEDWGPRQVTLSVPFNQQANGRSAFWVKLFPGAENFSLRLKGKPVSYDRGGDIVSFLANDAVLEAIARKEPLEFRIFCGQTAGGAFTVEVAD